VIVVAAVGLRLTILDIGRILSDIPRWGSVRDGAPAVLVIRRSFSEMAELSDWESFQLADRHVAAHKVEQVESSAISLSR
jgi:hypothetical protein